MKIIRLSIPGNECTHCGTIMTEKLKCTGCGWYDPSTRSPKRGMKEELISYIKNSPFETIYKELEEAGLHVYANTEKDHIGPVWADAYRLGYTDGYKQGSEHQKSLPVKIDGPPPKDGNWYPCWDNSKHPSICRYDDEDIKWVWLGWFSGEPSAHLPISLRR